MPIHFDHVCAGQTEFGRSLAGSTFTVTLVTGQSVTDISQNVFANLGWDEVRLPAPVFEGHTIYSSSEVLEKRESKIPSGRRNRHSKDHRLQSRGHRRDYVQAHDCGLQARPRPEIARLTLEKRE